MFTSRHLAIAMTVLLVTSGLVAGAPIGSPELTLFMPDDLVTAGEETELEVYILNGGTVNVGTGDPNVDATVTTARKVRMTMERGRAPIEVKTATRPVGNVPEGVTGPVRFAISVRDTAKPGEYEIPVEIKYEYTHQVADGPFDSTVHQETSVTKTRRITIRVERAARFEVVDATLDPLVDDEGNLTVTVRNTGTATARDARLTLQSGVDQLTFDGASSATTFVGRWSPGETRTLAFESEVAEGVDGRTFPLEVDVAYEDDEGVTQASETRRTGVRMADRTDRFVVTETTSDLAVGDSGSVTVGIRNVGDEPVTDARVALQSNDPKLSFAGATSGESFVGAWAPNETRQVSFEMSVQENADVRSYSMAATVTYRDASGERRQSESLLTGVVPRPQQSFEVRDVESTLRVGEEGTVRGTVVNTGEVRVRNAVVVFETQNPNLNPVETEYQVGDLDPLTPAPFSFDVEISDTAGAGPRQLTVHVRYRDADDDVRRSDPLDLNASVGPEQDVFEVAPMDVTLVPGGGGIVGLRVTNVGDEPVSDVSAKLFTSDPLSSTDDEAFVDRLGPGESATLRFQLSAAGTALEKVYPLDVDFQYDDADGDTHLSDTYKVPIRVAERTGGDGLPVPLIGGVVALLALVVGGYAWFRRR